MHNTGPGRIFIPWLSGQMANMWYPPPQKKKNHQLLQGFMRTAIEKTWIFLKWLQWLCSYIVVVPISEMLDVPGLCEILNLILQFLRNEGVAEGVRGSSCHPPKVISQSIIILIIKLTSQSITINNWLVI